MRSCRLLEEEEEKLKQLMHLKEEQERYIERAQQEKEEMQQEMALQSRSLQQAQQQLEEVRLNRQRADEDVEVRHQPEQGETGGASVSLHLPQSQATLLYTRIITSWLCTAYRLLNLSESEALGKETDDSCYHNETN